MSRESWRSRLLGGLGGWPVGPDPGLNRLGIVVATVVKRDVFHDTSGRALRRTLPVLCRQDAPASRVARVALHNYLTALASLLQDASFGGGNGQERERLSRSRR